MAQTLNFENSRIKKDGARKHLILSDGREYMRVSPGDWRGFVKPVAEGGHPPHWRRPSSNIAKQLESYFRKAGKK